jgi:hypothetical protein
MLWQELKALLRWEKDDGMGGECSTDEIDDRGFQV